MDISELSQKLNVSPSVLREMAKKLSSYEVGERELTSAARFCDIGKLALLSFLEENDLLERGNGKSWKPTMNLIAVAGAKLSKRRTEEAAWESVAKMIARTVVMDEFPGEWNLRVPNRAYVFGSLLDSSKKDFGDADLILEQSDVGVTKFYESEDYHERQRKQEEWFDENPLAFQASCWSMGTLSDDVQNVLDLKNGDAFLSIAPPRAYYNLSSLPKYETNGFPLMSIWKSDKNGDGADSELERAAESWSVKNAEAAMAVREKLDAAFLRMGLPRQCDANFKKACMDYVSLSMSEEILRKVEKSGTISCGMSGNAFGKALRRGVLGMGAILGYCIMAKKRLPAEELETIRVRFEKVKSELPAGETISIVVASGKDERSQLNGAYRRSVGA